MRAENPARPKSGHGRRRTLSGSHSGADHCGGATSDPTGSPRERPPSQSGLPCGRIRQGARLPAEDSPECPDRPQLRIGHAGNQIRHGSHPNSYYHPDSLDRPLSQSGLGGSCSGAGVSGSASYSPRYIGAESGAERPVSQAGLGSRRGGTNMATREQQLPHHLDPGSPSASGSSRIPADPEKLGSSGSSGGSGGLGSRRGSTSGASLRPDLLQGLPGSTRLIQDSVGERVMSKYRDRAMTDVSDLARVRESRMANRAGVSLGDAMPDSRSRGACVISGKLCPLEPSARRRSMPTGDSSSLSLSSATLLETGSPGYRKLPATSNPTFPLTSYGEVFRYEDVNTSMATHAPGVAKGRLPRLQPLPGIPASYDSTLRGLEGSGSDSPRTIEDIIIKDKKEFSAYPVLEAGFQDTEP